MAALIEKDSSGILRATQGEVELTERRTRTAKVFRNGQQFRVCGCVSPIHYRQNPFDDSEPLKEIDLSVKLTPEADWEAACETNGYQVRLWQSRQISGGVVRYIAQFQRAGRWFAMAPHSLWWENEAGERQEVGAIAEVGLPGIDNEAGTVTWKDALGTGLDWRYNLWPDRFFKTLIIRQRNALPRPTIGNAGLRLTIVMAVAWERTTRAANGFATANNAGELSSDIADVFTNPDESLTDPEPYAHLDEQQRKLWWLQAPMAWDSAEPEHNEARMQWRFVRKGERVFLLLSIPAAMLNAATYPVFLDAAISEEQVGASTDDAYSYGSTHPGSTTLNTTGTIVHFGATSSSFRCAGYRFQTIPIEPGVIIDSASLKVHAGGGMIPDADVYLAAEDVDDGATWGAGHFPSDAYTNRTTAQVRWTITDDWAAGNWYEAPNIAAPVQEVINRVGWAKNNDLNLVIYNASTSLPSVNAYRWPESYDSNPANAVKFNCIYHLGFDALLLAGD